MCDTIKHTIGLMQMSWRVLIMDRELVLFPVFSAVGMLILVGAFFALGLASAPPSGDAGVTAGYAAFVVAAYVIVMFFHAALVSAALERLRGGDPDVASGIRHALRHVHHIVAWAIISALVAIILAALRNALRRYPGVVDFILRLVGGVWEFLTFFVVPVIVSENLGPVSGFKRSASLVRQTWGRQITASFSFILFYVAALLIAAVPAVLIGFVNVAAGVLVGVLLGAAALMVVQTLEGIFKAALYDYAVGLQPQGFDLPTLQAAYRPA